MKRLFIETFRYLKTQKYHWIPSSLAFYLLLSILPLILAITLVLIYYSFTDTTILINNLNDGQVSDVLISFIRYVENSFSDISVIALIILLLYVIWLSSNGVYGLMKAVESLFGFEAQSYIKARIVAYISTVVIIVAVMVMVIFASALPIILKLLKIEMPNIISYVVTPITLYIVIHILYLFVTNFKLKSKHIFKGALFSTIAIYIVLIVTNLIFYNSRLNFIFGSFAIIILLSHLFYYISYCFYLGLVINSVNYKIDVENKVS